VSTDDPTGRRLSVTVAPDGAGAIRVTAVPSDPTGVAAMGDSFSSTSSEAFHGFGGRHNALDQHGQDFYNWLDQEDVSVALPTRKPRPTRSPSPKFTG
jgi:alpha-glucosidase